MGQAVSLVRADPVFLDRVVANLLDNAAKAALHNDSGEVEVKASQVDGRVTVRVIDHGTGVPATVREQLFKKLRGLEIIDCPFENLPEAKSGRWGAGLTAAKMKDCRWLKPDLVSQIEFLEWTGENHLRHTKFIALRDDKPAREVRRE